MSAILNIALDQGTVWRRTITVKTGTAEDAPRVDLTGYSIQAQARKAWDSTLAKQFVVEPVDLEQGEFDLVFDDTDRKLREFALLWDLLLTAPESEPVKYVEGTITITPTITRPNA
jgi:hypothetical protein